MAAHRGGGDERGGGGGHVVRHAAQRVGGRRRGRRGRARARARRPRRLGGRARGRAVARALGGRARRAAAGAAAAGAAVGRPRLRALCKPPVSGGRVPGGAARISLMRCVRRIAGCEGRGGLLEGGWGGRAHAARSQSLAWAESQACRSTAHIRVRAAGVVGDLRMARQFEYRSHISWQPVALPETAHLMAAHRRGAPGACLVLVRRPARAGRRRARGALRRPRRRGRAGGHQERVQAAAALPGQRLQHLRARIGFLSR